jgi:hypothetical protein
LPKRRRCRYTTPRIRRGGSDESTYLLAANDVAYYYK